MSSLFIRLLLFGFLCGGIGSQASWAQGSIADSSLHLNLLQVAYRPLRAGGDMGGLYGLMHTFGLDYTHKFPSNWYVHTGVDLIAEGTVTLTTANDVLASVRTVDGLFINDDGAPTTVRQVGVGFFVPFTVGKVIPVFSKANPNSGLYIEVGGQYLQHRLGFQVAEGPVSFLQTTQRKGYDRLHNGFGLRQGIGYLHLSNNGYFNFSIGFESSQSFTQNRRSINVDTGLQDTAPKTDWLNGLRVSWIFPIYNKAPGVYYY